MKTLFLLRHAKSSWNDPDLSDFDRSLNSRGLKAANFMGGLVFDRGIQPQLVVSSPAKRAKQTAVLVREIGALPAIDFDERIYEASPLTLFNLIREFDSKYDSAMIVGHNPGLEELTRILTGESQSMPTAALSQITLPIDSWEELAVRSGKLELVIRPRDLMDE